MGEAISAVVSLPLREDRLTVDRFFESAQSFLGGLSGALALLMLLEAEILMLLLLSASSSMAIVVTKCARIEVVFQMLTEAFQDTDIQLFSLLEMIEPEAPGRQSSLIDLYVRFRTPRKTQIFIAIRSMGKNTIVYSEAKESLGAYSG